MEKSRILKQTLFLVCLIQISSSASPPVIAAFSSSEVSIAEDTRIETVLETISVTDNDVPPDPIVCNIKSSTPANGPFTVWKKDGETNMNERPTFTNLPANLTIKEDAPEGKVITVLSFTDPDPYQDIEPICSVWPASEKYKFTFESNSNKLKLADDINEPEPLDYETTNQYKITCILYDGYLYNEDAYVNLAVLDVNEEPIFKEESYSCSLYESEIGVSQCDLGLTVTDPDSDKLDLVLLSGNNSERFSLINNDKKLTFGINYDVDDNAMPTDVLLTAGAVDEHGLTGTTKIAITVKDVNDNTPEFTSSVTSFVVSETQELGALGTVTALDKDSGANGEVTYTVQGGSQALGYVSLVGDGGITYSSKYPQR
ncbi:hypothetical protein LOTGIDRAFT_173039 [Lottia gigantea]|uniref:Cadherin domain-containing protein n=1 Tax=Lottia gigantea TaxID=225164 RepID=V4AU92_LOTGI|nr:hypothetical protein LOTGIDRAFT_173039 [Lottia gigantea]ESP00848.1 hypothetical protein LOTGIDRAFT_173039 [Lottia gigantea]